MAASSSLPQPPPPHTSSSLAQHASPSSDPLPQHLMYKNRLQEFAQRSNIHLPVYQTTIEGSPHAPRFWATVWVDGASYTSQMPFSQRKAAEQNAAKIALENLYEKIKDDGCPLVSENFFSKSIMNEYATKLNVERPTYNTVMLQGLIPRFESSVVFNGTTYTSVIGKNKKEAEQLAARAAILSILGDSSSTTLHAIIRSKSRLYAAVEPNESQFTNGGIVLPKATTGYASDLQHHNVLPIATTEDASDLQDQKDKEVPSLMAANNDETRIDVPASSNVLSSSREFQMAIHAPYPEGPFPTNFPLQPGVSELGQLATGSNSSSKRRKNRKKANKRARLESMLPSAAVPCSVTQ
ncbi:hypothetical protein PIB30_034388 [Stylosanthes scabra]|uniref:DRBM domain-containing protein n=1 Tax=Stylosanthes scabra TaxID=79078 RepID=A0ABU6YB71_9FABA|nr:hypothetical protein [Stylosanthes scabra]